uniref:Uncharacterized protein n=1 Tax=Heliothis virescens TaxID=7102 RepID=A0A2A4IZ74_HELVI
MERRKLVAKKKATELKLMFQEYKENDDVLKECKDRSSDYFTGGYFIETRNYYLEALNFIEQYIKQDAGENVTTSNKTIESVDLTKIIKQQEEKAETVTKSTEEKSETNNTNNKLTENLRKQTANYRAFQRTISNIDVGSLLENWELEDAIKTLESRWKVIDCLHWEIESELEAEDKEELELLYDKYEKQYLHLPVLKHQALAPIKKMHDVTQECLNAITNLGVDISTWDPLLVHILDQKLDADSHSEYIDSLKDRHEPETKTDSKQTGKKGNKRHCISATLYSVVMALTFFMTLISNAYGTSNITQLNENQAIYFDPIAKMQLIRHQWTLVAYYDMSPYWEGITAFKKYSSYLEQSCNRMNNTNKCNMIVPQQSHEYTELQYYNQLLLTQHFIEHSRRRRGLINGIGYLANGLFGVLDERFAEQYAQDIELIKRNEAHLKNLWSNQTSVVESEYNLIKRMEKMVDMQHKVINKHLNSLDKALNTVQAEVNEIIKQQEFILTAIAANTVLAPINHIINLTIDQGYEDNLDNQSNETETVHNNLLREIDLKLKQLKEEQKYESITSMSDHDIHHYAWLSHALFSYIEKYVEAGIQPWKRRSTKLNQCPGLLGSTNTNRKLKKNRR